MLASKAIDHLPDKTRNLVFGYIRAEERRYSLRIPELIAYTCAAFYVFYDEWDLQYQDEKVKLSMDGTCVHSEDTHQGDWRSMFGSKICKEKGKYSWKIKYIRVEATVSNQFNSWKSLIGIIRDQKDILMLNTLSYFTSNTVSVQPGYGFVGSESSIVVDGGASRIKYGEKLEKEGDEIEVILDLDANTLSYIMNGTDYGKAFNIEPCAEGYRLAVSVVDGMSLQLCD